MPINSKQKGKRGELDFCSFLRSRGISAIRSQQFKGSASSADVESWLFEALGLHPEVKRTEVVKFYPWFDKAAQEAGDAKAPVIFHRKNGGKWMAFLEADVLIRLIPNLAEAVDSDRETGVESA